MTEQTRRSVFQRYKIVSECDLVEAAQKLNVLQPASAPFGVTTRPATDSPADIDRKVEHTIRRNRGCRSRHPRRVRKSLCRPLPGR